MPRSTARKADLRNRYRDANPLADAPERRCGRIETYIPTDKKSNEQSPDAGTKMQSDA